jgi:hypothetical protein
VDKLPPEARKVLEKPQDQLGPEDYQKRFMAEGSVAVSDRDVLDHAPREKRPEIRAIIDQLEVQDVLVGSIARNRGIVNFEYWRTRCDAERTALAQTARKNIYDADRIFASGERFAEAKKMYEDGWVAWDQIFKKHPTLMGNAEAQDLIESVQHYRDLLNQLDERFPADFVLNPLLESHSEGQRLLQQIRLINSASSGSSTPNETKPPQNSSPEGKPPDTKASDSPPAEKKTQEAAQVP